MDKIDNYRLNIEENAISNVEAYIENLFHQWTVNEIYLGNIITAFSNLIYLLPEHSGNKSLGITAQIKNEIISFEFTGIARQVLTLFLKEHILQNIHNAHIQSVFLIQKIADEAIVQKDNLILRFKISALPDSYLIKRRQLLKNASKNTTENIIYD